MIEFQRIKTQSKCDFMLIKKIEFCCMLLEFKIFVEFKEIATELNYLSGRIAEKYILNKLTIEYSR